MEVGVGSGKNTLRESPGMHPRGGTRLPGKAEADRAGCVHWHRSTRQPRRQGTEFLPRVRLKHEEKM